MPHLNIIYLYNLCENMGLISKHRYTISNESAFKYRIIRSIESATGVIKPEERKEKIRIRNLVNIFNLTVHKTEKRKKKRERRK